MAESPLAKYDLQGRYGGIAGKTRGQEGQFQNGNGARDARRAARREQRPMTFAEMQQDGIARPAPMAPAPAMSSSPAAQMFTGPTASMGSEPEGFQPAYTPPAVSPYGGNAGAGQTFIPGGSAPYIPGQAAGAPAYGGNRVMPQNTQPRSGYDAMRAAALADLEAAFSGRRAALNEDLSRRGLYASSGELGAGARLGDLEGQYARARAGLEADLLNNEQGREMQTMQMLLDLYRTMFQTGGA